MTVTTQERPVLAPRGPDADKTWVKLVTDPKKAVANPKQVFPISEKQAVALFDYLAENGLFERVSVDPPGLPNDGWYVDVWGGPSSARIGHWHFRPDVRPASVGVVQHLMRIGLIDRIERRQLDHRGQRLVGHR